MGLILADTSFLIDLQKDSKSMRRAVRGFLEDHAEDEFCISPTVLGEFAAGFHDVQDDAFLSVRKNFELLELDEEVAVVYAGIFRKLKKTGALIGANDLWIAASALRHEAALVTRNTSEFRRIPGLPVLDY